MKNNDLLNLIANNIMDLKQPAVIGISGAYTSGKTTLTNSLRDYLNSKGIKVQIIHYDDYHFPLDSLKWDQTNPKDEINTFYTSAFNMKKLKNEVLVPLQAGFLKTTVFGLDWAHGQYSNSIEIDIDDQTVVLVEGMLLFNSELKNYFDYKIFLDIDAYEIMRRGRIRDMPKFGENILEKYRNRYIPVYYKYLKVDRPQSNSDLVIDYKNPE